VCCGVYSLPSSSEPSCKGGCAKVSKGTRKITLIGINLEASDRGAVGRLPLVIKRECKGQAKNAPIALSVAFKRWACQGADS
jgi:hypothetical protein